MNSGGFSISKENEAQWINCWVPATPNNMIPGRVNPVPIQLLDNNSELSSWQQLLEFPNDQPLGSVNSYQSVQDIDPYQQVGRNGVQIFNPNSFMALLGVDGSYGLDGALLDENRGINGASQGNPNMHGNLRNEIDTLRSNSASLNHPWMASQYQYAAQNRGPQLSQVNSDSLNPPWMPSQFAAQDRGPQLSQVTSASLNPPLMASQFAAQNRSPQLSQVAAQNKSFQQVNRPAIPNLNVQASADWMDHNSANMPIYQNHHLMSSSCTASKDVFQLPEEPFRGPSRVEYNLNAPAITETEPSFIQTLDYFHQAASATINQASNSHENRQCETLELPESDRQLSLNGDKQTTDKQITVTENGTLQLSDLVQPNGDTSSRIISTPEKKTVKEKEGGQVIDLDKTPHHKTPKRRKHRPKVIREGKPKKAPKSETPKNSKLSEKPRRKYTRKSSLNASGSHPSDVLETGGPTEEPAANSCRRALSFENEKTAELAEKISNSQPEQMRQMRRMEFDLNLDNQTTEICSTGINMSQRHSAVQTYQQNESLPSMHPRQVVNNLAHSVHKGVAINNPHLMRPPPTRTTTFQDLLMGNDNGTSGITTQQRTNISMHSERCPPTQATSFQDLLLGNQNYGRVSASSHIVHGNQNNNGSYYPVQRFTSAENNGQLDLQTKHTHDNLSERGDRGLMILSRYNQPVVITSDGVQSEARRSKREREFISEQQHFHGNASVNASQSSRVMDGGYQSECVTQQKLQESEKRRRLENMVHMQMCGTQNQHFAQIKSRQTVANNGNCTPANTRPSHFPYPWLSNPTNICQSAEYRRYQGAGNGVSASSAAFNHYFKQLTSSEQPSNVSQMHNMGNLVNLRGSPTPVPASNHNVQHTPAKPLVVDSQQSVKNGSSNITEKQYSRPTASGLLVKTIKRAGPSGDTQAITKALNNGSIKNVASSSFVSSRKKGSDYQTSSSSKRGQLRKKDIRDLIDDIVHQMEEINLDGVSKKETLHPENAVVLYKGDGPVVMYQAKKRKPRPKVDLDAESERIWKLLMGKEGPSEGTDADKEKWWEQERYTFNLRADSFISRMHLVQGDRRFSKWKGSVVDSVIGVFLTQNVSDHLSSSAFMSLAARFPLSLRSRESCTGDDAITEELEICIIDLEDTTINDEAKQALSYGHFAAPKNEGKSMTSETEIVNLGDDQIRGANNETVSLDSFDSFIRLTNRGSSSGSKSEVEEQLSTPNPSSLFKTDKPTEIAQTSLRDSPLESPERSSYHLEKTQGASEKECQQLSGGESVSSCLACDASECSSNTSELQTRGNSKQNEHPREKTEGRQNLNEQLGCPVVHQQGIPATPCKETTQHLFSDHPRESLTFQSEKTSEIEGVTEAILKKQGLPSAANFNRKGSSPKARKGKQDADKKTVDWDVLRKEAQRKIRRSKNKNNMDSMDYETMRHAEVKEISDAIKERGMNNMLAERIKDFLNRLVTDHGSIDLEWLRDAPPDKAKDYLLSIRGLGLKSVECVRLLTLHHLAFPVDTNVGRIAVRLGWVPLQPLPESLQLHLLEMYPILETIQKYLWPRLCKLDQRTLYELHYQMITFGKVFCTKSKPNCNACPMRAECRHFASAFASARLALPAPEERNILPSGFSLQSDWGPVSGTPSRTLLEWDNHVSKVERFSKTNCEPIVEEPKTPEQEPDEVSEIDIEDSFGEDPDEIPTIKLDVPKFSQTLQSYMHDNNIEVQEGDMSNALVALTAEAASLQPQKLKNVSRLRTEHQVYELPDDHPLLKEMDKREPDDPSPYLLAIWTPGETALSTQPPESRCQSDDPCKMCSEQTCFSCNSKREADSNIVRGTLLIPCRTAMRGSFPLNGTYFQVNEMFADHESSMNPIDVPREWIWDLPRRTVYFGTSASTIFKGMTTEGIQYCFWRGFVCVRGFDQRYRAPRPLLARLHHPASKLVKTQGKRRNDRPVQ